MESVAFYGETALQLSKIKPHPGLNSTWSRVTGGVRVPQRVSDGVIHHTAAAGAEGKTLWRLPRTAEGRGQGCAREGQERWPRSDRK